MTLLFAFMIIVVALELERAKDALQDHHLAAFSHLPGFGLIGRVDAVRPLLEKIRDHLVGRFENGGANKHFEFVDGGAARVVAF